jgi:K+-transporting ATPase KdpF subunit
MIFYGFLMLRRRRMRSAQSIIGEKHGLLVPGSDTAARAVDVGRRDPLRTTGAASMNVLYWISLIVAVALFGYLLYAMLNAEDF